MSQHRDSNYEFEVFFDGDCPLCEKEIRMLRWMDRKNRLRFTNIAASDLDEAAIGKSFAELMEEIHGRFPNGDWVIGVEVFRQLYSAVGLRWLVWPTRLPGLRWLANLGYRWFAKNRLRLTGRCDADCRVEESAVAK
ncbi:MAG: thiol-disulfide oxidoreductase DCC family protein [Pirellulaceae bacterium]